MNWIYKSVFYIKDGQ